MPRSSSVFSSWTLAYTWLSQTLLCARWDRLPHSSRCSARFPANLFQQCIRYECVALVSQCIQRTPTCARDTCRRRCPGRGATPRNSYAPPPYFVTKRLQKLCATFNNVHYTRNEFVLRLAVHPTPALARCTRLHRRCSRRGATPGNSYAPPPYFVIERL